MKVIAIFMMILFSISTFANSSIADINYDQANLLIQTEIGEETTCVDDYLKREEKLRKFLIWAPPATIVAAPTAFAIAGFSTAAIMSATATTGWSALGYTVGAAVVGGGAVLGTFIGLETVKAIEFFKNRYMIRLITAVQSEDYNNKQVRKFINKYRKKYTNDISLSDDNIYQIIKELDYNGSLCNGEVTGNNTTKIKRLLAKRKSLSSYIHNQFSL